MSKSAVISLWREAHVDCRRWRSGDVGAVLRRAEGNSHCKSPKFVHTDKENTDNSGVATLKHHVVLSTVLCKEHGLYEFINKKGERFHCVTLSGAFPLMAATCLYGFPTL